MKKEYAVYKGEKLLCIGTVNEIAKELNVKEKTVYFWASPANIKRAETGIRKGKKPRKKECSGVKMAIRL